MNISFLNPIFLWGVPLISLPIIIHLLTRKKAHLLNFSSIQFIKLSAKHSIRIHRLRQLIILLIRTIIISLIVFVFSRPLLQVMPILPKEREPSQSVVIIVDNSFSMSCWENTSSRFEKAIDVTNRILKNLEKDDRCALFLCSDHVEPVVGNLTADNEFIMKELTKAEVSRYPTDLEPAFQEAYKILSESKSSGKQIILITDLAENGWRGLFAKNMEESVSMSLFDPMVKVILVDVGEEQDNLGIVDVEGRILNYAVSKRPIEIIADIHNYSSRGNVSLSANLSMAKLAKANIDYNICDNRLFNLSSGENINQAFMCRLQEIGAYIGKIEIDKDYLTADDKYYFAIEVGDKINVLVVNGDTHFAPHKNETFYLEHALNPKEGESHIKSNTVIKESFDDTNLHSFDVVILANVQSIQSKDISRLWDFLKSGGSLIFFLGDNIDSRFYNSQLSSILPAIISDKYKGESQYIKRIEMGHPIFRVFDEVEGEDLARISFKEFFNIDLKEGSTCLMELSDNACLFAERVFYVPGMGKVLLFTSSVDRDWNNFPTKPTFLPFVQQCVEYLVSGQRPKRINQLEIGQYIRFPQKQYSSNQRARLVFPDGSSIELRPTQEAGFLGYIYGPIENIGLYQLKIMGDSKIESYYISNLNRSKNESNLERVPNTKLKKMLSDIPVIVIDDIERIEERLNEVIRGKEITYSLAILLIMMLFLEQFIAHRKID